MDQIFRDLIILTIASSSKEIVASLYKLNLSHAGVANNRKNTIVIASPEYSFTIIFRKKKSSTEITIACDRIDYSKTQRVGEFETILDLKAEYKITNIGNDKQLERPQVLYKIYNTGSLGNLRLFEAESRAKEIVDQVLYMLWVLVPKKD